MFERTRQGTVDVISASEPLVSGTVAEFRNLLDPLLTKGFPRIVMNLASVPLIDSAGLEALLEVSDSCQDRGGNMFLAAPNALCQDILRITRVDQSISVYDDATQAIRSFSQ